MHPSVIHALFNLILLAIGLCIIYWYANQMLTALAKSTRYVPVPMDYFPTPTKGISREEQIAVIDYLNSTFTPYGIERSTLVDYQETMIQVIPKVYLRRKAYEPFPIKDRELMDLLATKWAELKKQEKK